MMKAKTGKDLLAMWLPSLLTASHLALPNRQLCGVQMLQPASHFVYDKVNGGFASQKLAQAPGHSRPEVLA